MVHTFLGEYQYRIDTKGRVAIPARFREAFKEGVVVAQGFEKCINVYSVAEWEKVAEKLTSLPMTRQNARRINRAILSSAFNLELDRQGRVVLPSTLKDYAAIKSEVVIAGLHSYLEIWNAENWAAEKAVMRAQAAQIAEQVEV